MKKTLYLLVFLVLLAKLLEINLIKTVNAQTCGGILECCEAGYRDSCVGGPNDGAYCVDDDSCSPGGTCEYGGYCVDGANNGKTGWFSSCEVKGDGSCQAQIFTCPPGITTLRNTCGWIYCDNDTVCEPTEGETSSNCADCPATPPASCTNNIQDGSETGVDCGGAVCPACGGSGGSWGSCGSCSIAGCGAAYSRLDPSNNCVCDPSGCGYNVPAGATCALYASPVSVPVGQTVGLSIEMRFANVYGSSTVSGDCTTVDGDPVDWPPFGLYLVGSSNLTVASTPGNAGFVCGPPSDGNSRVYSRNVRGESIGSTSIVVGGVVSGPGGCGVPDCKCILYVPVTVTPPLPWWQVKNGNVMVGAPAGANPAISNNAGLTSQIPATCVSPGCNPNFIINDTDSNTPSGVAIAPGTAVFRAGSSTAKVNTRDWLARTHLTGDASSTDFYFNLADSKVVYPIAGDVLDETIIDAARSNWVDDEDVAWLKKTNGDLEIRNLTVAFDPSTNTPRKVVVLIECGDLKIGELPPGVGRLHVNDPNSEFVAIVVGKCSDGTKGKVTVRERVKEVDGIIIADGDVEVLSESNCTAGTDDRNPLNFRGNLVAKGDINLNRDFCQKVNNGDDGNEDQPTETFENLEEWDLFFPTSLSEKHVYWREIAP